MTLLAPSWSERLGYTAMNDRQVIASMLQPGVIAGPDFKVAAGSGLQSTIEKGRCAIRNSFQQTQGGLYIVQNTATALVTHAAGNVSNPRIDQIFARVFDSADGGDSSDIAEFVLAEGTPTSGATLANRNGAAARPRNSLRFADILVPAGAASSAAFTYRDRRPWAKGAFMWGGSPTVETESHTPVTLGNMKVRLEDSFQTLVFTMSCVLECTLAATVEFGFARNGVPELGRVINIAATTKLPVTYVGALQIPGGSGEIEFDTESFLWELQFGTSAGKLKVFTPNFWIEEKGKTGGENGFE